MARHRCRHCGQALQLINYALGPEWMHVDVSASFPTQEKGTAWRYCRLAAAEPAQEVSPSA